MADAVCLSRHQCVVTGLISPSVLQPLMTTSTVELLSQSGYCYYYWKCQDYSAAITQLWGHCTKSRSKAVAQLNADVCWPSEWTAQSQPYDWRKRRDCQKWETGPSLWWQTIPCLRCSHRKGAVAKGSPTSQRLLQCRGVSRAETATSDDFWCPTSMQCWRQTKGMFRQA